MRNRMRSREVNLLTDVILAIFQTNGRLLNSGDILVAPLGLTSARWQVLGAVALSDTPLSAPQIGAVMGITRQGAQKQINLLIAEGLLEPLPNPTRKRSPRYALTRHGQSVYTELGRIQTHWANQIVAGFTQNDLITTKRMLNLISLRLEASSNWSDKP